MYHLVNIILFQNQALLAFIDVGVNASRESKLGGDTGQVVILYHVVRVPYDGVVTIPDLNVTEVRINYLHKLTGKHGYWRFQLKLCF